MEDDPHVNLQTFSPAFLPAVKNVPNGQFQRTGLELTTFPGVTQKTHIILIEKRFPEITKNIDKIPL